MPDETVKKCLTLQEYLTMDRPKVKWLVEKLIPQPGLILLMGPPKLGKSFMALQLAMQLARGEDIFGFRTPKECIVLYIQLDTSEMIWRDRLDKLSKAGVTLPNGVIIPNPLIFKPPCIITQLESRNLLKGVLSECDPDLVILDVYREIHQNNENDSTEMKIVNDCIQEVFGTYSVILVHHSKKAYTNAESGDTGFSFDPINESRGSSGITGRADALWSLRKDHLRIVPRFEEPSTIYLTRLHNGLWSHQGQPMKETDFRTVRCLELMEKNPKQSPYKVFQQNKALLQSIGVGQATFYRILQDAKEKEVLAASQAPNEETSSPDDATVGQHCTPSSDLSHTGLSLSQNQSEPKSHDAAAESVSKQM